MEVFSQYAVAASREAFAMQVLIWKKKILSAWGVIVGSGIGSLPQVENNYEKILTKDLEK